MKVVAHLLVVSNDDATTCHHHVAPSTLPIIVERFHNNMRKLLGHAGNSNHFRRPNSIAIADVEFFGF